MQNSEKRWTIVYPGDGGTVVQETLTEKQILDYYFPHWCKMMAEAGRELPPNAEQVCIDDWTVTHWATEETVNE
jgi:hypothetical protein